MSKDTANTKDLDDVENANTVKPQRPPLQTVNDDALETIKIKEEKNVASVSGKKRPFKEIEGNAASTGCMNKKAKQSFDGRIYEIQRILHVRESYRRSDEDEYLVQWEGYPMYEASWHHRDNFTDPTVVDEFMALSKREKRKRLQSWKRSLKAFSATQHISKPSYASKATQTTTKDEESDSDDLEILHPPRSACPGTEQHWEKVKDTLDELHAETSFILVSNATCIHSLLAFITNVALFVRNHKYCEQELNEIKSNLKKVYMYLEETSQIYASTQLPATEDEIDADECESDEARSQDSRPAGTQTDEEITDKEDVQDMEVEYDPLDDM